MADGRRDRWKDRWIEKDGQIDEQTDGWIKTWMGKREREKRRNRRRRNIRLESNVSKHSQAVVSTGDREYLRDSIVRCLGQSKSKAYSDSQWQTKTTRCPTMMNGINSFFFIRNSKINLSLGVLEL